MRADLEAALDSYERSLSIRRELADVSAQIDTLTQIAMVHQMRGDNTEAARVAEELVTCSEHVNHPDLKMHRLLLQKAHG